MNKKQIFFFAFFSTLVCTAKCQETIQWFIDKYPNSTVPTEMSYSFSNMSMSELEDIFDIAYAGGLYARIQYKLGEVEDEAIHHKVFLEGILCFIEMNKRGTPSPHHYMEYALILEEVGLPDLSLFYLSMGIRYSDMDEEADPDEKNHMLFLRGKMKYEKEDYYGAISDLNRGMEISPDIRADAIHRYRGYCYVMIGEYKKGMNDLNMLYNIKGYFREIGDYYYRAMAHLQLGNKMEACSDISAMGDLGGNNKELLQKYCR